MYLMSSIYTAVERSIIMGRPLKNIIRIQGIEPYLMMNKNGKEDAPNKFLTQAFDRNIPTAIEVPFNN